MHHHHRLAFVLLLTPEIDPRALYMQSLIMIYFLFNYNSVESHFYIYEKILKIWNNRDLKSLLKMYAICFYNFSNEFHFRY